jgi:hypothetical protein
MWIMHLIEEAPVLVQWLFVIAVLGGVVAPYFLQAQAAEEDGVHKVSGRPGTTPQARGDTRGGRSSVSAIADFNLLAFKPAPA